MQRKDAILHAACDHFGRFGFRGASLRDIARDAGVSLTLLNHHFGCKAALLSAVVAMHRPTLQARTSALRRLANASPDVVPRDLVKAWIEFGFACVALPQGLQFMRLLARLDNDAGEEGAEASPDSANEGAELFIDALQRCYPDATRAAAACAWQCANACLLKILAGTDRASSLPARQVWLERFLLAGIGSALGTPHVAAFAIEPTPERDQMRSPSGPERAFTPSPEPHAAFARHFQL